MKDLFDVEVRIVFFNGEVKFKWAVYDNCANILASGRQKLAKDAWREAAQWVLAEYDRREVQADH